MNRLPLAAAVLVAGVLLGAATPALASNAQLRRVAVHDAKFITRDGNALAQASAGNDVGAIKATGHNLGLGLSEFIKDVTPITTSGSVARTAKALLLHGLQKMRHGVQELNHGIKEALAGDTTKAKAEIAKANREVTAGAKKVRAAGREIKSLAAG